MMKKFVCAICGFETTNLDLYVRHMQTEAEKAKKEKENAEKEAKKKEILATEASLDEQVKNLCGTIMAYNGAVDRFNKQVRETGFSTPRKKMSYTFEKPETTTGENPFDDLTEEELFKMLAEMFSIDK